MGRFIPINLKMYMFNTESRENRKVNTFLSIQHMNRNPSCGGLKENCPRQDGHPKPAEAHITALSRSRHIPTTPWGSQLTVGTATSEVTWSPYSSW